MTKVKFISFVPWVTIGGYYWFTIYCTYDAQDS